MNGFKWFLIIAFALFTGTGIWQEFIKDYNSKQDIKSINDTTKKTGNNLGLKMDTNFKGVKGSIKIVQDDLKSGKKVVNLKKLHAPPYALLRYSPISGLNPSFTKINKDDTLKFTMFMTNYGTGLAYDIRLTIFFAYIINGNVRINSPNHVAIAKTNKATTIYPSKDEAYPYINFVKGTANIDSTFVCVKVDYSDSTGVRKTLPQIFFVDKNEKMTISSFDNYNKIEAVLIENKYWTPPFTQ